MQAINFEKMLQCAKNLAKKAKERQLRPFFKGCSVEMFRELFIAYANVELSKRDPNSEFIIDDDNRDVINQLYFYMIGSDKYEGNLNKGILLLGNLGSGKTIIMQTFVNVWNDISLQSGYNKVIKSCSAVKIVDLISQKKLSDQDAMLKDQMYNAAFFVDDIGKEKLKVVNYGTEEFPLIDMFLKRYDKGCVTFATGNYKIATLTELYGETVADRLIELFHTLVLKGDSRRK